MGLRDGPGGYRYCRRFWRNKTQQARAKAEITTREVTGKLEDMWNCSAMNILRMMRQTVKTNRILYPMRPYSFLVTPFNLFAHWWSVIQDLQSIGCTYHLYGAWKSRYGIIDLHGASDKSSVNHWWAPRLIFSLGHWAYSIAYVWINDSFFVRILNTSENIMWTMINQSQKELDRTWIPFPMVRRF